MKHVISVTNPNLEAYLDPRFGRANWLCLYDDASEETRFIENAENFNAPSGAGIQTATKAVALKAHQVVSGHFGPKAAEVLSKAGMKTLEIHEEIALKDLMIRLKSLSNQ